MAENTAPEWLQALIGRIGPENVLETASHRGQETLLVKRETLLDTLRVIKDSGGFRRIIDVTALDFLPAKPRFQVVYHLWSHADNRVLRVKTVVDSDPPALPSAASIWAGADWHERECFDLFGIVFEGHPDLKRILLPEHWEDYPLRKDFPVEGR